MAQQEAEATRRQLFELLMQAPALIALLRGPQHVYELANQLYMEHVGQRAILGQPIRTALPELEGLGIFELLDQVYATGQPFVGKEMRFEVDHPQTGQRVERYYSFVYQPVRDSEGVVDGIMIHGVEVTEHVHKRHKIQESEARLQRLVNSNVIGVTFTRANGAIIDANERFLGMLGYTRDDVAARMSGFPSAEAMLTASRDVYHQTLKRFVVKDENGHLLKPEEFPGRRALREGRNIQQLLHYHDNVTGRSFWSSIKSQPIFNEEGQAQLVVNVLVDVSEQQALEQRKNEFISMASHELKTPVTSLKGFTNVLQRRLTRQGDEQGLYYLSRMDAQLDKLTSLINELLDISRMQSGKLLMRAEPIDLDALIEETVEMVQATTSTHHLHIEGRIGTQVLGDQERLGQVFINLLTNAIKYSPQADAVRLCLAVSQEAQQAVVSVRDFGIGIDQSHHERIFERFYQVTDPEERTYPGLGIGLYISNEIVARHRGRMWVESSKGNGATFYVALPLLSPGEQVSLE